MLLYDRNQHSIVKQLYVSIKTKLKKKKKSILLYFRMAPFHILLLETPGFFFPLVILDGDIDSSSFEIYVPIIWIKSNFSSKSVVKKYENRERVIIWVLKDLYVILKKEDCVFFSLLSGSRYKTF